MGEKGPPGRDGPPVCIYLLIIFLLYFFVKMLDMNQVSLH